MYYKINFKHIKQFLYISILIFSSFVWSQKGISYDSNKLMITLKSKYFDTHSLDLSNNKTGVKSLDIWLKNNDISKINSIGKPEITKTFLLSFGLNTDIDNVYKSLKNTKEIAVVEYDYFATVGGEQMPQNLITPNDSYFFRQWGLLNNGTLTGIGSVVADADVDMELAWDIETGDPNMIIAVPDTGLKMNHPDIASRIWTNTNEIAGNNIDDDNNGYIDDVNGWDFVNTDNDPTDDHGHGTNCTSIIGAIANNSNLFTGGNWNSKVMPLKVLNGSNSGSYSAMTNSIYYAVDNGAKIISMSIGGSSSSTILENAIQYGNQNNVTMFFCMMNFNNNVSYYPARYSLNHSNVVAVGATNPNDTRTAPFFWDASSGSNYGTHINVVAPGNYIYGLSHTSNTSAGTYWGGTSQATPLVASIASLMLAKNPALTPAQIRTILQNTAQDMVGTSSEDTQGFDQYMGYGRVNANSALQAVLQLGINNTNNATKKLEIINPVKENKIDLYSYLLKEDIYSYKIYSIDGKLLSTGKTFLKEGKNEIQFDYTTGNYIIEFNGNEYSKIFKLLKM